MAVLVLDKYHKPLMPCSEKRARKLLARGRARVHKLYPFTIRLVDRKAEDCTFQPIKIKIDPGSKTTGIALVRESETATHVLNLVELAHRGRRISESLTARRQMRATGSFNIQTAQGLVQGISHRFCKIIQHADGYGYSQIERGRQFLPALKDGVSLAYVR